MKILILSMKVLQNESMKITKICRIYRLSLLLFCVTNFVEQGERVVFEEKKMQQFVHSMQGNLLEEWKDDKMMEHKNQTWRNCLSPVFFHFISLTFIRNRKTLNLVSNRYINRPFDFRFRICSKPSKGRRQRNLLTDRRCSGEAGLPDSNQPSSPIKTRNRCDSICHRNELNQSIFATKWKRKRRREMDKLNITFQFHAHK